jgi:hypothetical protein
MAVENVHGIALALHVSSRAAVLRASLARRDAYAVQMSAAPPDTSDITPRLSTSSLIHARALGAKEIVGVAKKVSPDCCKVMHESSCLGHACILGGTFAAEQGCPQGPWRQATPDNTSQAVLMATW